MTRSYWITVALLVALGGIRPSPFLLLTAALLATLGGVVHLWARLALSGVRYRRTVTPDRLEPGQIAWVTIEVENAKALPLPWLRIDDPLPGGVVVLPWRSEFASRSASRSRSESEFGSQSESWSTSEPGSGAPSSERPVSLLLRLAPYGRFVTRFEVEARERGVHSMGPVWFRTGDPFGFRISRSRKSELDRLTISPARHSLESFGLADVPRQLEEIRTVDAAEPTGHRDGHKSRSIVLALDLSISGALRPGWRPLVFPKVGTAVGSPASVAPPASVDRGREWMISAAASLATTLIQEGWKVGLETGVHRPGGRKRVISRPGDGPDQIEEILAALAWLRLPATLSGHQLLRASARRAKSRTIILFLRPQGAAETDPLPPHLTCEVRPIWIQQPEISIDPIGTRADTSTHVHINSHECDITGDSDMEYRDTWIERALFPFVRVVLRLAWTWPWLALLSQLFLPGRRPGTSLLALIGLATMGYTIGKVGRRVKSVPAIKGLVLVLFAIGAVLTTSWFLIYRSIVPLLDPIWLRDLGLEITQGGGMMVRRVLAILAGAFVCVSGMLDAEDPPDHAAIWASFTTTITLLVIHASLVELVPDLRIAPPTPWLVLVFALGMIALLASGSRLGQRIEPRVPRPWQIG